MSDCSENSQDTAAGTMPASAAGGSDEENPRLGRYPKIKGSQAPQMKNSNTIIKKSRKRIVIGGSTFAQGEVGISAETPLRRLADVTKPTLSESEM
jgi:hypothetical protein